MQIEAGDTADGKALVDPSAKEVSAIPPLTDLYIGSPIEYESERAVLKQVLDLLARDGRPAVVFANVSLKARQIDFIVGLSDLVLVIEAKGFTRPVRGGENGPWQVQVTSGDWKNFRNPYVQARDAALEVRDAMRSFAGGNVPYPAAAIVFVPRIPDGSRVYTGDFKVSVTDLAGLDAALREQPKGAWLFDRWMSFAGNLGLTHINSVAAAYDDRLAEAEELLRQYSAAYSRAYTHPERVVPFMCRLDGEAVSSEEVVNFVADGHTDILVQGPSGCGKTLLAGQAGNLFSQRGGIVITIPIKDYSDSIKVVLNREVGLLCGASAVRVLSAARRLNRPLLFVVDGYNECAAPDRPSLTRALSGLARIYEASFLVTSQCPLVREDLLPLQAVGVPPATPETKTAIALDVTGDDALPNELEHLLDAVATGLEARLIGEAGQQLSRGSSRYALFDAFARKRLDDMASDGIRLLSKLAEWLSQRFAFSLSVRDLDRLIDLYCVSYVAWTRLLSAGLLTQRGDRISFAHEMFFHAFAAENVVRGAAGRTAEVLKALASPQHADRKALIIGAIDDNLLLDQVLEGLTDTQSIAACIAGTCGQAAREWAEKRCGALWDLIRAEALGVSFCISDQGVKHVAFEETTLTDWTASERALLSVMPQRIVDGHYLDEILDATGILDQRIVEEQTRLRDEAKKHRVALQSAMFANAYFPMSARMPRLTHIFRLLHGHFFRPTHDAAARTIQRALQGDSLSPGQVYLLLTLSRGTEIAASLIAKVLKTHWRDAPYHLRLAMLNAARMRRPANHNDRATLIESLEVLPQPRNVFVSTAMVEGLRDLGAFEEPEREHIAVVRKEVGECLADPESADSCSTAYGLYSAQFDHPFTGAYSEVIADLPKSKRKTLLTMAANGADDTAPFLVPLLIDLASFEDSTVGQTIARWTVLPPADSVMPQDDLAVFLVAHIALGRLGCALPDRRSEADCHSAEALVACGALLYWCNCVRLVEATWRHGCEASLHLLVRHERGAALDVLRHCEHAFILGVEHLPGPAPLERSLVNAFPVETAEICRNALSGSACQVGYFRYYSERDHRQNLAFAIDVLGRHGNSTDIRLLRGHAEDATLGASAISALRMIEERLAAA